MSSQIEDCEKLSRSIKSGNLMSPMSVLLQCFLASGICAFSRRQTLCTFCIQFAHRFLAKVLTWMGHRHSDFNRTWFPRSEVEISWQLTLEIVTCFICPHWCNSMSHWSGFYGRSEDFIYSVLVRFWTGRVILDNADWTGAKEWYIPNSTRYLDFAIF